MAKKEFNLSSKTTLVKIDYEYLENVYREKDIKIFIKRIEDEINSLQNYLNNCHKIKNDEERLWVWENIKVCQEKINQLAGDKLIK